MNNSNSGSKILVGFVPISSIGCLGIVKSNTITLIDRPEGESKSSNLTLRNRNYFQSTGKYVMCSKTEASNEFTDTAFSRQPVSRYFITLSTVINFQYSKHFVSNHYCYHQSCK